jgi:hypothetical protein
MISRIWALVSSDSSRCRRSPCSSTAGAGAKDVLEVLGRVRPPQEVVGACLDGLHDLRGGTVVGDHDHGTGRGQLLGAPDELDARHPGQPDRDHGEGQAPGAAHHVEGFLGGAGGERRVPPGRELRHDAPALVGIALDDENGSAGDGRGVW